MDVLDLFARAKVKEGPGVPKHHPRAEATSPEAVCSCFWNLDISTVSMPRPRNIKQQGYPTHSVSILMSDLTFFFFMNCLSEPRFHA